MTQRKNRILLKLLDEAVFPAFLILAVKLTATFALIKLFSLPFSLSSQTLFPLIIFDSPDHLLLVNTYSNLLMLLLLVAGVSFTLYRAHFTHDTHIHPALTLKLLTLNLGRLISSSFEIYHQATVWLAYLWFGTLIFALQSLSGTSHVVLTAVAFLASITSTAALVVDIERELPT